VREIKFRGKRIDTGEWVHGYYVLDEFSGQNGKHGIAFTNDPCGFQVVEVIPKTVGQFTNLRDENGREIYEGDILQNSTGRRWVVDWRCDEKYCGWDLRIINSDMPHCIGETYTDFNVIGNIHDNPELVEDGPQSRSNSTRRGDTTGLAIR